MTNAKRACPEVNAEGFTTLYSHEPVDTDKIVADLVFVHGLMGHPRKTWQCGKTPKETKKRTHSILPWKNKRKAGQLEHEQASSDEMCYWPFDLLPSDVKNVRILTYGYDSHPSHFCTGPTNRMTISQHAENLLKRIVDTRSGHATRPIVFIAHSLGGILVKDAIVESRKFSQNSTNFRMRQVYEQCRAIFFFGTPHSGATLAEWGLLLSNILGSIPGPVSTYSKILRELGPDSEKLEIVTKDFNDVLDADTPKWKRIRICSLCEGKGMSGLNFFDGQVVPTRSATFGRRDIEVRVFIEKNHMNMCRFESASDPGYKDFKRTLLDYLDDIQQAERPIENVSTEEQNRAPDARCAALLESLDFADRYTRENQLRDIQANPRTFEWAWASSFARWLSNSDGLFWICGKPASGKSTLIHHMTQNEEVRRRLRHTSEADWLIVHHFFDFHALSEGQFVRNTFQGVLRSLLFQLISSMPEIAWDDGMGQHHSSRHVEQHLSASDLRERLRKILEKSPRPICIFVDGLDEYASGTHDIEDCQWDLAGFLKEISGPRSKLCIASRPEKVFLTAFAQIPSLMMQDWNLQGIYKYVDLTLERSLATSGFYEDEELVSLSKSIAARSEGVFLWAHFAMNQLRNGWARGDDLDMPSLRTKLDKVPSELAEIYSRIFRSLRLDDRRSVGHMLQLICFARRTLSLDELWAAMERVEGRAIVALTARRLKRFEQRVYAITGGILDVFWTERETCDEHDMNYGHHLPNIDEDEYEEGIKNDGPRVYIRRGDPVVVLIHRTVQDFLDSKGWSEILESTEDVELQSEKLWLRLCMNELCSLANAADSTVTTADSMVATLEKRRWASLRIKDTRVRDSYKKRRFILPEDDATNLDGSTIQASMTTSFLQLHAYHWVFLGYPQCSHCRFAEHLPRPAHPLHLAVAHGLNSYVSEYLTSNKDLPLPETYTSLTSSLASSTLNIVDFQSRHRRVELLEFAAYYAGDPSIISTILTQRELDVDAAVVAALYEGKRLDIIQSLLQNKAASGPLILSPPDLQYMLAFQDQPDGRRGLEHIQISTHKLPHLLASQLNVRPLWVIGRSRLDPWDKHYPNMRATVDFLISRGEDINGICEPFGTALHAVVSSPNHSLWTLDMIKFLIERGAHVNAESPLGTPLELSWSCFRTSHEIPYYAFPYHYYKVIETLIKHGGVNNRPDPEGGVPSIDQMMAF